MVQYHFLSMNFHCRGQVDHTQVREKNVLKVWALSHFLCVLTLCQWAVHSLSWWLFPRLWGFWENVQPVIPSLCFFLFLFLWWRLAHAHFSFSLYARISPQWLSKLRLLAKCSLASCVWALFRIGSHTMPAQRLSQPIPTSLGQECMRVYMEPATCTFGRMTFFYFYMPLW